MGEDAENERYSEMQQLDLFGGGIHGIQGKKNSFVVGILGVRCGVAASQTQPVRQTY